MAIFNCWYRETLVPEQSTRIISPQNVQITADKMIIDHHENLIFQDNQGEVIDIVSAGYWIRAKRMKE